METPILSKKQQKSSLSAKKAKVKTTVKNVLMTPYKKYWPLVSSSDQITIQETLGAYLPRVAREKIKLLYKELIKVQKSDRKNFRQEYYNKHNVVEINHELRQGLILGINDVTKLLEENNAAAVLISSDVQPRLIVEHIIDQCILNNVPVLVMPCLRDILKKHCGIKSAAVAISKNTNNEHLNLIHQKVGSVAQSYPHGKDETINSVRVDTIVTISDDSGFDYSENRNSDTKQLASEGIIKMDTDESENIVTMDAEETESNNKVNHILQKLYLKRDSGSKKRVFVPVCEEKKQRESASDLFLPFSVNIDKELQFIQSNKFGNDSITVRKKNRDTNPNKYRSLKVKRMKGDVNRIKKKVEQLKKKK